MIPVNYIEPLLDDGTGPEMPYNKIAEVVFCYGTFGVRGEGKFISFIEYNNEGQSTVEFEIIGNIFENPELLEIKN